MSGYFLKNKKLGLYLKKIDTQNEAIEFTKEQEEAKNYTQGSWFAESELDFARFHFPEEEKVLNGMECVYED